MAPTIHLVRHAQGFHNLSVANETMRDPDLTDLGLEQCAALRAAFPSHGSLTRLVASPMRRTLYTCINGFGVPTATAAAATTGTTTNDTNGSTGSDDNSDIRQRLYPVLALDLLQEVSDSPCDTGSSPAALTAEFGADVVDVGTVRADWMEKGPGSEFEPRLEKLIDRGVRARRALREIALAAGQGGQGDGHGGHVVAVSHGGFLHFLTDDWQDIPSGHATGWKNCEFRSYQFVDPTGQDEDAALQETKESWRRRKGQQQPSTETERRQIRAVAQKEVAPYLHLK